MQIVGKKSHLSVPFLVLFGKLSKATGKKVAGATAALDEEVGSEAASIAEEDPADKIKSFGTDGNFN